MERGVKKKQKNFFWHKEVAAKAQEHEIHKYKILWPRIKITQKLIKSLRDTQFYDGDKYNE